MDLATETQWQQGDSVLLCEANVTPQDVVQFTGARRDGPSDRAQMMFDFLLNPRIWLALARRDAEPLIDALTTAVTLPKGRSGPPSSATTTNWTSRLTDEQRGDVFAALHLARRCGSTAAASGAASRRCSAGIFGTFNWLMPCSFRYREPRVLRYGEEIGMGEDLRLNGRDAIRTPMQWDDGPNGGFSSADPASLPRPVAATGRYGAKQVNVRSQQRDPTSLLRWFENLVHILRIAPEIGTGTCIVDLPLLRHVLAHRFDAPAGSILLLHNLADTPVVIDIGLQKGMDGPPYDLLVDGPYDAPTRRLDQLRLNGWGYRWIRLARSDQR